MQNQPVLGIDIGGSGIKGALVDLEAGDFATERVRIPTPEKSTPANVAEVVANLSTFLRLAPGDLIFTGTPAGVSTVVRGDTLEGGVEGVGRLAVTLA